MLNAQWSVIGSVEGGEILAKLDNGRFFVSFPSDLPTSDLAQILANKGIPFEEWGVHYEEWDVQYHAGESEGETVAIWIA